MTQAVASPKSATCSPDAGSPFGPPTGSARAARESPRGLGRTASSTSCRLSSRPARRSRAAAAQAPASPASLKKARRLCAQSQAQARRHVARDQERRQAARGRDGRAYGRRARYRRLLRRDPKAPLPQYVADCLGQADGEGRGGVSARVPGVWRRHPADRVQTVFELANEFPIHVVCERIGNSAEVARKHYLHVTEEHFEKATSNPTSRMHADSGIRQQTPKKTAVSPAVANDTAVLLGLKSTPTGSRTPVFGLRTRRPGPLDDGGRRTSKLLTPDPGVSSSPQATLGRRCQQENSAPGPVPPCFRHPRCHF